MSHRNKPRTHQDYISEEGGDLRDILDLQPEQLRNLVNSSNNLTEMKFQKVLCRSCALVLTAHTNVQENPERKLLKLRYSNLKILKCYPTPGTSAGTPLLTEKYWSMLYLYSTIP